jgi:hypothetical protein
MTACNAPPRRAESKDRARPGSAMKPLHVSLSAIFAGALILQGGFANAEVKKFLNPCGGQQMCPTYQLVMTPPDGWVPDEAASVKNKAQIIVPKGTTFATAEPLIYVQVSYHSNKDQSLANFAQTSNTRWVAANPNAKISELPAVPRANGKQGFLRFAFSNPSRDQQSYEIGAFGVDNDNDGNEFVLDVVMTGSSKQALDRADKDYVAFLKAN